MRLPSAGRAIIFAIILSLVIVQQSWGLERCNAYVQPVRAAHIQYCGIQWPYWYGVGQLQQESNCRASVTAFDAGQGIAQFMPKTSTYIQGLMGERLDPYNPNHAVRMQAFYMARIHRLENWVGEKPLWIDYQIYNGGAGTLKKEAARAGIVDWDLMLLFCERKKIPMKWGVLDFCTVNYDYSKKIEKYGNQYRRGLDGLRYW